MARNSGILIRQLFGSWSNPCAGLLHHRRKLLPNSIQTLNLTSIRRTAPSSLPPCKLSLSSPYLHLKQFSDSDILFSSPTNMVIISNRDDYNRAVTEVKDGLLPAVFYFIYDRCSPVCTAASRVLHRLREQFPHVTIFKVIKAPAVDIEEILVNMDPEISPTFHCYLNGEMVSKIGLFGLHTMWEELYSNVILVQTTKPKGSSGMGKRKGEQLDIQAKKDENDKGVVRGGKVGSERRSAATLLEQRGGLVEAVESSTAPSLHEVMRAVESLPGGHSDSRLWWFARGLFKCQPKKRVMFSKVQGPFFKIAWLLREMAKE
ncbi:hypothetical protein CerSpe_246540 [Prunus speciosa]